MVRGQPGPVLTPLHAGVLGSPSDHSLSPTLHRAGYEATGLADWRYTAHEVDEGGLAPFVTALDVMWRGLSLTMPLKVAAFAVADGIQRRGVGTRLVEQLAERAAHHGIEILFVKVQRVDLMARGFKSFAGEVE